jgi:glyoxylase-like metal-dependent hydrolase (beta-lactamase superfamily II)
MNAFLIEEEGGGVTLFDTGSRSMSGALRRAADRLGGLRRIVLSHAHVDHRGGAPGLGMPVWIHAADRADAEGDAGRHYMHLERFPPPVRWAYPWLQRMWDGGPVPVAGTIAEGEEIAGFRVVHLPGHAPGQVGLLREHDGVALVADCFLCINVVTGMKAGPQLPHDAFNADSEQARESVRKLAALAPSAAWPGHGAPLRDDVRATLERLAAS